ncbi:MAG: hypothetical protein AB7S26_42995 [Sandaracinaceae bacterium]
MSGRRYPKTVGHRGGSAGALAVGSPERLNPKRKRRTNPEVATPAKFPAAPLPKAKPRKSAAPKSIENQLADAAVAAARVLARAGFADTYDTIRSQTIRSFAAAFAQAYGMPDAPHVDDYLGTLSPGDHQAFVDAVCAFDFATLTPEQFGCVHEVLTGWKLDARDLVSSRERHAGGVHFTPRSLTEPIVHRTLEPILSLLDRGEWPPPETPRVHGTGTLVLRVCDPSVGAGAFLLEAVRQLAQRMVDRGEETDLLVAKRLVALHCCYGLDISRWAVASCKIALWLECRAWSMPTWWLDDNIKMGDAVVGLDLDQIARFHWSPNGKDKKGQPIPEAPEIRAVVDRAMPQLVAARVERMTTLTTIARSAACREG